MKFILEKEQLDVLINYMAQKPYVEVFRLIDMLQKLQQANASGEPLRPAGLPKLVDPPPVFTDPRPDKKPEKKGT